MEDLEATVEGEKKKREELEAKLKAAKTKHQQEKKELQVLFYL